MLSLRILVVSQLLKTHSAFWHWKLTQCVVLAHYGHQLCFDDSFASKDPNRLRNSNSTEMKNSFL